MAVRLVMLFTALLFVGCATQSRTHAGIDRHGNPTVTQTGGAKEPGKATVTTSKTTLTIPAGSKVEIPSPAPTTTDGGQVSPPSPVVVTLSQPSELRTETRREAVEGTKTPEPPPPPSPSDLARATGIRWFYFAGLACAAVAGFCVWRGYPVAAVKCAAAAVAFPLVGNFVSEKWAIVTGGVLLLLAGAFVVAWKIIAARHGLGNQAGTVAK